MKKFIFTATTVLLALTVLGGCSKVETEPPVDTDPSASYTESTAPSAETDPFETEADDSSIPFDAAYTKQIERYYTSLSEQWDQNTYFDNEMSALTAYYYEGNALYNVGFTCIDLDGDNSNELVIGAIMNAEKSPLVFEIWTLKNGEPTMLAQSGSHNRYYLQYTEEDGIWSIAYEAENGAANHAVYYLQLTDGKLEVIQGIVFDAVANESAPWFMAYDLDWDVSNDTPIDEDTANDVLNAGRNIYTAAEYIPYSQYR